MTIELAERLIPKIDSSLLYQDRYPQNWSEIKSNFLASINDKKIWWQLEKFASHFYGKTLQEQIRFLEKLHQFVFEMPYQSDGFKQQEIKQPAVSFHERKKGLCCKDKSRFLLACFRHLGISASFILIAFRPKKKGKNLDIKGHIYTAVYLGNQKIIIDSTLPLFGVEYQSEKIIHKEEILCF